MTPGNLREHVVKLQSLAALAVMVIALSLATDDFLKVDNGVNVLRQISVNLCLSIGMTMVIIAGGIDLSVGSVLALSGAIAAGLLKNGVTLAPFDVVLQFTPLGAIVAGVAVGAGLGWHNGVAITRFKLPPFVATLGMLSVARGLTMLYTGGHPITGLGPEFGSLYTGQFLRVPTPVWIAGALALSFALVTRRTRLGRYLYAVGGNERAAALSGLDVRRVKMRVYTLAGALAGVGGLIAAARVDAATPNVGIGYELDSIAAVVIGGTSLTGGRGSIFGTVIGCLIIGVLNNGLVLLEVSPNWQPVIKGYVLILAVALDRASRREG
jgi:ribose transport system permease protein